jgi:MinD superfamily P-loop ATPase
VKNRQKARIEKWNVPVINGLIVNMHNSMIKNIHGQDKKYWVDQNCNGCGICEQVCPVKNIVMNNGRPSWTHSCEACLACLHWCPQTAIQYGKVPAKHGRYHNPEVSIREIIAQK